LAWLSGYSHRILIPINHSDDGELTSFQVRIAILEGIGSNSAGSIYLNDWALNWPYDIRFTSSDGSTLIDFWRQEYDATDGTWIVEVPTIADSGTTDIYLYWGKAADTDASSAANTAKDGAGYVFPVNAALDADFWDTTVGSPLVSLAPALPAATSGVTVSAVSGKYEAWPTIVRDSNGRLYQFYRTEDSDTHPYSASGKIAYRTSDDDGATWSDEVAATSTSDMDERDPGALVYSNGGVESVMLVYNEVDASANSTMYCQIAPISTMSFADKITIKSGANRWSAANPVELSDGTILLPCYTNGGNVYVEKSTNDGASWSEITVTAGDTTYHPDESCIIELKTTGSYAGKVALISRCEVSPYGYRKSESADYGDTWGAYAAVSTLSAPDVACPIHVGRMQNGGLSAIYTDGYNIVQYISQDEAVNWIYVGMLVDRDSPESKHYAKALYYGDYVYVAWCTNSTTSNVYFNKVQLFPFLRFASTGTDPVYYQGPSVSRPAIVESMIQFHDDDASYKYPTPFGFGRYIADYSVDCAGLIIYTSNKHCLTTTTGGNRTLSGTGINKDNAWSLWKIVWAADLAKYFDDGSQQDSNITTNVPSANMPIWIGRTVYTNVPSRCLARWIFVRKYTANEPTWATPGSHESYSASSQIIII